jgi:hypothetical protein
MRTTEEHSREILSCVLIAIAVVAAKLSSRETPERMPLSLVQAKGREKGRGRERQCIMKTFLASLGHGVVGSGAAGAGGGESVYSGGLGQGVIGSGSADIRGGR